MSISANTVVSFDNTFSYDAGANARSQIIAASLDLLYRWNNGTGPEVAGDDYHTVAFGTSTASTNRSFGRQLALAWDGRAALRAELVGAARKASRFGTLSLRAAVNFADLRNPVSNGTDPASAMQDFDVVLIDRAGSEASVRAAGYGTALEPSLGSFRRHVVLNGLRIPLSEFSGVDCRIWRRSSCASARRRRAARSSSPTWPSRSRPPPRRSRRRRRRPLPSRRSPGPSASTASRSRA